MEIIDYVRWLQKTSQTSNDILILPNQFSSFVQI